MYSNLLAFLAVQLATPAFAATLKERVAGRTVRCCTDAGVCNLAKFNAKASSITWVGDPSEKWKIDWREGGSLSIFTQPSFPTEPGTFLYVKGGQIRWDPQVCTIVD